MPGLAAQPARCQATCCPSMHCPQRERRSQPPPAHSAVTNSASTSGCRDFNAGPADGNSCQEQGFLPMVLSSTGCPRVSPAGTSLAQALEQSSPEVRANPQDPGPRALEELTWGDQSRGAPSEKDPMTAGSHLPGILLSVPDCDQETLLLILLLHWAVTRAHPISLPRSTQQGLPSQPQTPQPPHSQVFSSSLCTEHCSTSPKSNLLIPDRHMQGDVTSPGQVQGHHSCTVSGGK